MEHNGCCPVCRVQQEECHEAIRGMKKDLRIHMDSENTELGVVAGQVDVLLKMAYVSVGTFGLGLVLALVNFVLARIP